MIRPVHISAVEHVVARRLGRVLGPPVAPVRSQVLDDIAAGRAREHAATREGFSLPALTVLESGRVVLSVPVRQLPRGSYPPEWLD